MYEKKIGGGGGGGEGGESSISSPATDLCFFWQSKGSSISDNVMFKCIQTKNIRHCQWFRMMCIDPQGRPCAKQPKTTLISYQ